MGSETSSGSLYIVKLSELLDLNSSISSIKQRIHEVTTFNCTIWTIDYNFNGNQEWLASLSLSQHAIINTLFYFLIWCSNWFNLLSNSSFSCHVVQIGIFFFFFGCLQVLIWELLWWIWKLNRNHGCVIAKVMFSHNNLFIR